MHTIMTRRLFDSELLREAQEGMDFLAGVLEASTEYSIIGKDLEGKILLWNEGARRLYGYEPEEVVGRASSFILHTPEDVDAGKPRQIMDAALRDGKWEGTIQRVRKNGQRFTARLVTTPRRDGAGRPIGFLLISKDISDEIRLTEELKATQFYTRSLIESNVDALMTTDSLGVISDVNQQMEALTGYSRQELIGSPFKNYFTEPARARAGVEQTFSEGVVTEYALTLVARSRRQLQVSFNASVFRGTDGRVQGIFASARDVTERKHFEQTLQEKNVELDGANFAKDRFLASMSHELRTPLNAIIGFTGTLLMKLPGPLTTDQDSQLRTVQTSARHLLSLINDLLDLAKIESGKVEMHVEDVACGGVVEEVAQALSPLAQAKGLEFKVDLPPQDVIVRTDRRALSQVLINLTNNAIKFTNTGRIELRVARTGANGRSAASISVIDTGVGVRPEDKARLFHAFEQLETTSTRRHEGTGLGLHLSQKLAVLLGGHLTFESEYGKGSTFAIVLPERS